MEPMTGQMITGKTVGILGRLPHFCHVEQAGGLLAAVVDIFGRRLERAEADLYRVLRAHQVETADNEGFQGYTAPPAKRGDLDKIFALYLEALGGTDLLVKVNPYFTVRSLDVRRLARLLVEENNPFIAYFRRQCRPETWDLLLRYDAKRMQFDAGDIQPGFALALLLGRTGIARHVRAKLAPATQLLLSAYDGGDSLNPRLQAALAADLNERLLPDPSLFRNNLDEFSHLPLPPPAMALSNSLYLDYLREHYRAGKNPLLASLQQVEPAAVPAGDDQIRLNRLLLEAAFPCSAQQPWGFRPRGVPMLDEVREALTGRHADPEQGGEFNRLLTDPALYTEERFPELVEDYPYLQKRYRNEPVWLNRMLLEAAFPTEIERSYAPYRERLLGLIAVLRRGASTLQGIIDIVAANLGIVGDDPQARAAKALIQVAEFDPDRTHFFEGPLSLYQEFEVNNSNPDEEKPEIWLKMLDDGETKTLCNVRFEDRATRQHILVATRIQPGDTLTIGNRSVLLNGVTPQAQPEGEVPTLKSGTTRWRFVADLVAVEDNRDQPAGRFDQDSFGESVWVNSEPVVNVQVLSYRYTPGTFTVVIPWHIPGFTDKFAETEQHPRHQILALVNRVKAAGIQASVAYQQVFREDHDPSGGLGLALSGALLADDYDTQDKLMASNTQQTREDQDIVDTFSLSGRFDLTGWDTLNSFSG